MMLKLKWETDFQKTELGEIPREWKIKELGDIFDVFSGKRPPHVKDDEKFEIWGSNGFMGFTSDYNSIGEILITGRVGTLGHVFYLPEDTKIWVSDNALIIKKPNDSDAITKFYFYNLNARSEEIIELNVGSTQPLLTQRDLKLLKVPHPPPDEQDRIAAVLSWFDDLIENKKRQNEILEKTAMAIFKSRFVDFEPFRDAGMEYSEELGREVPRGWEVRLIGKLCEMNNGISYTGKEKHAEYVDGSFIFITLNNAVEGGGFKPVYAWIKSSRIKERHYVKEGDLIIPNTEQTKDERLIGSPGIVYFPPDYPLSKGVFSHHITRIVPKDEFLTYFLYLYLKFTRDESASYATGTGVLGMDIKNFKRNKLVLLPPDPVLQRFHEIVEILFRKIINNEKEIMVLKKVRDDLLPLLVFGKLRVVEL